MLRRVQPLVFPISPRAGRADTLSRTTRHGAAQAGGRRLMTLRVLPAVALLVLAVAALPAQPAAKPDDPPTAKPEELTAEALARNKRLKEQYQEFEATLARVGQRLARSEKPEDQQKAAALQQALQVASDEAVEKRFETLIR